jgi:phage FluMu protein Com
MIAQITPGELNGVSNALSFAGDMVIEWLVEHKFKNWNVTEVKKRKVTPEQKKKQAEEIVSQLVNHTRWRTHGRSIKIEDLERLGLKIFEIDSDPELSDIIYRIQTVIKLIFGNSSAYKYLAAENVKLALNAAQARSPQPIPATASSVELDVKCQRCGKVHKLYAKLEQNQNIDKEHAGKGSVKFPSDNKLRCDCGFEHDLMGMRNAIEKQTGRKIVD